MLEISQEDLGEYGYDYYNNFNYDENNMNENNEELIQKNNLIIDITPLTRDKFKDYQLLVIKRNGNKYFLRFNTYTDDYLIILNFIVKELLIDILAYLSKFPFLIII